MKSILISLMCLFALNIKSQNVDTSKITYKIKIDISSYSRNCSTPTWFESYLRDSVLDLKFLTVKGLINVSIIELNCNSKKNKSDSNTCDYFGLYGKGFFVYDHIINELYNINLYSEESRTNLKLIFTDRVDYDVPVNIIKNKEQFSKYFKIENVNLGELFDFMTKGKKTSFNSFGKIKFY